MTRPRGSKTPQPVRPPTLRELERERTLHGVKRLHTLYTPYYLSGERVEVTLKTGWRVHYGYGRQTGGKIVRFYVGRVESGGVPYYTMELTQSHHHGWHDVPEAHGVESIRGLGIFRDPPRGE